MKKPLFLSLFLFLAAIASNAQEARRDRPHFSPEEFQEKQRTYITEKADLSPEEADAFFPLFFELQKMKFELEHDSRKNFKKRCNENISEEECRNIVYHMADTKVEIAKLEREYTDKYLEVLPACKVRKVLHAECTFQRDLMKKMTEHRNNRQEDYQTK